MIGKAAQEFMETAVTDEKNRAHFPATMASLGIAIGIRAALKNPVRAQIIANELESMSGGEAEHMERAVRGMADVLMEDLDEEDVVP